MLQNICQCMQFFFLQETRWRPSSPSTKPFSWNTFPWNCFACLSLPAYLACNGANVPQVHYLYLLDRRIMVQWSLCTMYIICTYLRSYSGAMLPMYIVCSYLMVVLWYDVPCVDSLYLLHCECSLYRLHFMWSYRSESSIYRRLSAAGFLYIFQQYLPVDCRSGSINWMMNLA